MSPNASLSLSRFPYQKAAKSEREEAEAEAMNSAARSAWGVLRRTSQGVDSVTRHHRQEQCRGIRVKVLNGNLEQALAFMQRKMQSSGIERMIKRVDTHHVKNSEKRVLAGKSLQQRLKSEDMARKLQAILMKKVRGL